MARAERPKWQPAQYWFGDAVLLFLTCMEGALFVGAITFVSGLGSLWATAPVTFLLGIANGQAIARRPLRPRWFRRPREKP